MGMPQHITLGTLYKTTLTNSWACPFFKG